MSTIEKKQRPSDSEQQVLDFLSNSPDFFSKYPYVLESLHLPHNSGAAVSLIEKQLSVLRERNTELRTQLNLLMERSRINDELFAKSRTLVLELIAANGPGEIVGALLSGFRNEFGIEYCSLTLLDSPLDLPGVNLLTKEHAQDKLAAILNTDDPLCGVLRSQQLIALFDGSARKVGSAIALRLAVNSQAYGVLALGSSDSHYYHNGMDTLFLRFLADILNQILYPRL